MEVLNFFVDLAKALFGAFGTAVSNYPLPTVLVFFFVFAFMNENGLFVLVEPETGDFRIPDTIAEIVFGLVGFVLAVVFSNFFGYLFYIATHAFLGAASIATMFASPFAKYPAVFTVILLLLSCGAGAYYIFTYYSFRARSPIRSVSPLAIVFMAFVVLFGAYVITPLYVSVRGGAGPRIVNVGGQRPPTAHK